MARLHVAAALLFCCAVAHAEELANATGLAVGDRAPVSGVYFATGPWKEISRMTCPAAKFGKDPKLVIYTTSMNESVLNLARKFDAMIAAEPALKWSFVSISDAKGGHRGIGGADYYNDDELAARLTELERIAADHKLANITLGITMAPASRERTKLRLADEHDLAVAFIGGSDHKSREIKFIRLMHSSKLTDDAIASIVAAIDKARGK